MITESQSTMFWQFPAKFRQNTAVVTDTETLTYEQLQQQCDEFMEQLPEAGQLVFLLCKNDLHTLIAWLACLNKKVPVLLLDAAISQDNLEALLTDFEAVAIVSQGNIVLTETSRQLQKIDPRLAVLISTSGSTGSAKQVALSFNNLQANAESICRYLPIGSDDITITTLPFHYSFGLSVINTHLLRGASIVISEHPMMSREFWDLLVHKNVSSFAGVPYTYEMLKRLGFLKKTFPALRYMTQAGGRLADDLINEFAMHLQRQNKALYVMYGQTEATARMAWLNPQKLPEKVGSIGNAIPGGQLTLVDEQKQLITDVNTPGELVYSGDNIMLGYANNGQQLESFEPVSQLFTGDLAVRDEDGDYFIVGRTKRFVKIFGLRINLDEVELLLEQHGYHAKVTGTDKRLYLAVSRQNETREVLQFLSKKIKLHPSVIRSEYVASYPLKSNQKTDYSALLAHFEGRNRHD